jgi:hypothetical protein
VSEERAKPSQLENHEEFVQHMEVGSSKIRGLSILTVMVALLLALSYLSQLALPLTGTTSVTVNVADPTLIATELIVLALTLMWLYIGLRNYFFSTRLSKQIAVARAAEAEFEKAITN